MPIYEYCCVEQKCSQYTRPHEHYVPLYTSPDPDCEICHRPTRRMVSSFAVVFTGPLTKKYNDPSAENAHQDGGHWVFQTKDEAGNKITPTPRFISSFQEQKEYCKLEGLVNPKDIGPAEIGEDGKSISTRGLPGCW